VDEFELVFDGIRYDWDASPIYAIGGSTHGNIAMPDDPLPAYKRGIWFNGEAFLTL
jgi:hypothetical protein